jgi:hypothetical protein
MNMPLQFVSVFLDSSLGRQADLIAEPSDKALQSRSHFVIRAGIFANGCDGTRAIRRDDNPKRGHVGFPLYPYARMVSVR